jgi:uncharacterized protein YecE (DUF72 family)
MLLRIGQSRLRGDISRYARGFDLLEVRAEPGTLPRPRRLRQWRSDVPPEFVFSVRLPSAVAALTAGDDFDTALGYALRAAEALEASWLVLNTPACVTPGTRTRQRLSELGKILARSGVRLAWEPAGLWEAQAAERVAGESGFHLVRDLLRSDPPSGETLYTRLRGLGGARFGVGAAERLAETLVERQEAYVVVDVGGAQRGAQALRGAVTEITGSDLDAPEDAPDAPDDAPDRRSAFAFDETDG